MAGGTYSDVSRCVHFSKMFQVKKLALEIWKFKSDIHPRAPCWIPLVTFCRIWVCPGAQAVCKLRPSSATPRLSCCVGDLPNLKPAMDLMDSRLGISIFETGILCDWKERCPCILQRKFLLVSRAEMSWKGRMSLMTLILQTHRAF